MNALKIGDLIILENKIPMFVTCRFPLKRFEFKEGTSNKFWEIWIDGKETTTRWGKIGTEGQSQSKSWKDSRESTTERDKIVKEKLAKGYKEINGGENFIYVFNNPAKPGGESWLSSFDVEAFIKKNRVIIQQKK